MGNGACGVGLLLPIQWILPMQRWMQLSPPVLCAAQPRQRPETQHSLHSQSCHRRVDITVLATTGREGKVGLWLAVKAKTTIRLVDQAPRGGLGKGVSVITCGKVLYGGALLILQRGE